MDIEDYKFSELGKRDKSVADNEVLSFNFNEFKDKEIVDVKKQAKIIKLEREKSVENSFAPSAHVLKHRGHAKQAYEEREERIEREIAKRLELVKDSAYQEGLEKGVEEGKREVEEALKHEVDAQIEKLSGLVSDVLSERENILHEQEEQILEVIKSLTKWVCLKEINEDQNYIKRLFNKLAIDIKENSSLLVQVNKRNFESMPEIVEEIQKKFSTISDIRLEVDEGTDFQGLRLETATGILDARIETQMERLSHLFDELKGGDDFA